MLKTLKIQDSTHFQLRAAGKKGESFDSIIKRILSEKKNKFVDSSDPQIIDIRKKISDDDWKSFVQLAKKSNLNIPEAVVILIKRIFKEGAKK